MFDWSTLVGLIATATFDVVYFGVVLGTILVIVLDNRNPVKTLAWILVLIFCLLWGLFLFFFGRSQRHVRIINRKGYNSLQKNHYWSICPRLPVPCLWLIAD